MPILATKKTGRQLVEGLFRKAHFPPVHAQSHRSRGAEQLRDDARVGNLLNYNDRSLL
jgi:hypothetical protein